MYYNFGYDLPHVRNNRLSREVLPRVAASHDPFRFFLPSSPYIPLTVSGDLNVPEQHNWGAARLFQGGLLPPFQRAFHQRDRVSRLSGGVVSAAVYPGKGPLAHPK